MNAPEQSTFAIITDEPGKPGGFWHKTSTYVAPPNTSRWLGRVVGLTSARRLAEIAGAIKLFSYRRQARAYVTTATLRGTGLACLQRLLPLRRRVPHVMFDCLWYSPRSAWRRKLARTIFKIANPSVKAYIVWARHEVEDYAREFGIPCDKLVYVPYFFTLWGYEWDARDDGYVFAGGNYDRDYRLVIDAVRDMQIPLLCGTTRHEYFAEIDLSKNVKVQGYSHAEFRQAMAASKIVVVPMQDGLLHSGGQQTALNAMYMGKPTIVVGRRWGTDLIEDRVTGFIVDYGDVNGLRETIQWIVQNPQGAREIALRGMAHAGKHTSDQCFNKIISIVTAADTPGYHPQACSATTTMVPSTR